MTLIKHVGAARRSADTTRDALFELWEHQHAPFFLGKVQPVHYRLTFVEGDSESVEPRFDGLAEIWYRDAEHQQLAASVRAGGSGHNFSGALDRTVGFAIDTTEHVIVDGTVPEGAFKTMTFIRRRDDVTRTQIHERWLENHAPNVARWVEETPDCLRYVVSLTLGHDGEYDGIAETWWTSAEARTRALPQLNRDGFSQVAAKAETLVGSEIVIA